MPLWQRTLEGHAATAAAGLLTCVQDAGQLQQLSVCQHCAILYLYASQERKNHFLSLREREVRLLHDVNVQIMRRVPGRYILLAV